MAKNPYFKFYVSDWLGSNNRAAMTLEQQGAYINLLARQWSDKTCSLPDDDDALARLSEMGQGWFKGGSHLVRECFPPHPNLDGRIANPKLLELRADRDEWIEKSSEGGRKSAENKKLRQGKGGVATLSTKRQPKAKQPKPKPKPKKKETPLPPFSQIDFPDGLDTQDVRTAISEWLAYKRGRGETYKQPATQITKLLRQDWCVSPEAFVEAVNHSIAQNYAGCFPRKGGQHATQPSPGSKYDPERPVTPL